MEKIIKTVLKDVLRVNILLKQKRFIVFVVGIAIELSQDIENLIIKIFKKIKKKKD